MADRPYTNLGLRTFLLAMEEVLGEKGVTVMLNELAEFLGLVSNSLTTTGR